MGPLYLFLSSNVIYYGYTTENIPICISKALVSYPGWMFTDFLIQLQSYAKLGQNKAIQPWSYMGANVLTFMIC
jgi:hypothetical protein